MIQIYQNSLSLVLFKELLFIQNFLEIIEGESHKFLVSLLKLFEDDY